MSSKSKEADQPKTCHVVPEQGGWAVKGGSGNRAARVYATQAEAIAAARRAAAKNARVVIHARDGRVRQTLSQSRADELMLRVWQGVHADNATGHAKTRKAG